MELIEKNKKFKVTVLGEPQMSKRDLYTTLSRKNDSNKVSLMMNFISLCDGDTSLLNIANQLNTPAWDLYPLINKLESLKLIIENKD